MPTSPPPDIPHTVDPKNAEYLRRLILWMRTELEKRPLTGEAATALLLTPSDQKKPSTVWSLTVNSTGVVSTTQVPLGGGKP